MTRTHLFLLLAVAPALITVAKIILSFDWMMMAAVGLMFCVLAVLFSQMRWLLPRRPGIPPPPAFPYSWQSSVTLMLTITILAATPETLLLWLEFAALTALFFLLAWWLMQWIPSPIVGRRPLPLTLTLMALTGLWLGMTAMLAPQILSPQGMKRYGIIQCKPPSGDWVADEYLALDLKAPLVLATADLREALTEAANVWATQGHERPMLWFATSSTLAQQAATGHADLFLSADTAWMDYLQRHGQIQPGARATFAVTRRLAPIYANDAQASPKARVAARLSNTPIHYSLALLKTSNNKDAEGFRRFLLSAAGQAILARHGFTRP